MRRIAKAAVAAAALSAISIASAAAQEWPTRSVKIIVAFSPGGSADQFGRLIAEPLSETFGQQFYIEYHPGSSGTIGAGLTARAAPDGYTLMIGGSGPHLTSPAINPNVGYDPMKDFTHIAMIGADGFVLIANPTLGIDSLADVVKAARAQKQAPLTFSSPGPGSLGQLMMEEFKRKAGIELVHVPAPNSGLMEVLGNHIAMSMTGLLTSGVQIKAGGVKAVAVTSTARNPVYKDIPTFTEQGYPDVHGDTWFWLTGPKNLPPTIVDKLNSEVRRILKTPKVRDYFERQAALAMDVDVAGLNTFLAGEVAYWGGLAKSTGLSVQ
jgi:tripartite-type tricarboxylate transporter receptor subunit TctC